MNRLSVVVITKNEETNIDRCLRSVSWADELIVVDSYSTDRTTDIAREHGAKVVDIDWQGYGPAKQRGVEASTGEWVLSLDADEEVSRELADEIRRLTPGDGSVAGYEMPRRTQFLGRWILHCGWYPDYLLRLFRRDRGRFTDAVVHEHIEVDGAVCRLKGEILHYSYPTLEHYLTKFNRYTTIGAEEAFRQGRRGGVGALVLRPAAAFVKHYIVKRGFLDGTAGLVVSAMSSVAVFVKYAKLRDLYRQAVPIEQRKI